MNNIDAIRGKHQGRLAIVAGSGPSLRHLTPEAASKHVMIAVNNSIIKFPEAQYFFSCDPGNTLKYAWQFMKPLKCKILLGVSAAGGFGTYSPFMEGGNYKHGFAEDRFVYIDRKVNDNIAVMKPDDRQILFGTSSTHCALHVAFLMGCSPIVLVGCDCGPEDGKMEYTDFPGQEQYRNYVMPELKKHLVPADRTLLGGFVSYWDHIGASNPNVNILNCGNAVMPSIEPAKLKDVIKV